jgi:carbon-monoxide dehydrogenase medium subunit
MTVEVVPAASLEEAVATLVEGEGRARVVGGGVALALRMRLGEPAPERVVSLRDVPGLEQIDVSQEQLSIGCRVTFRTIATSEVVRSVAPALAQMCKAIGNTRVRNVATLAGNLAEADHASDPPTLLICLDAACTIEGPSGTRIIPVAGLIKGPRRTSLSFADIISAVHVPLRRERRTAYVRYLSRSSQDAPCVVVAAGAVAKHDGVEDLQIVIGATSHKPVVPREAAKAAEGRALDDRTIAEVAESCADSVDTIDDLRGSSWYRREMVRVLTRRALVEVAQTRPPGGA